MGHGLGEALMLLVCSALPAVGLAAEALPDLTTAQTWLGDTGFEAIRQR